MTAPYWTGDGIELCREIDAWLTADVHRRTVDGWERIEERA